MDIHRYSLQTVLTEDRRKFKVWMSTSRNMQEPIEEKYLINLTNSIPWRRFYDQDKMKYVYEYYCLGKWHRYWEISNEGLYRYAGQPRELYFTWLRTILLEKRNEMRCYKVERIDSTAEIGQSSR